MSKTRHRADSVELSDPGKMQLGIKHRDGVDELTSCRAEA